MADELTYRHSLSVRKGTLVQSHDSGALLATMTGDNATGGVQAIGTGHGAIVIGAEVATTGWAWFRNTDTTNFVTIGVDAIGTFWPLVKLKPGETASFRLGTNAPYAKADTATVNLHYMIYED